MVGGYLRLLRGGWRGGKWGKRGGNKYPPLIYVGRAPPPSYLYLCGAAAASVGRWSNNKNSTTGIQSQRQQGGGGGKMAKENVIGK